MPEKKKTKNEYVDSWMKRLKAGLDYRKKYSSFQRWSDYRKMYRGQWDEGIVPVNRVFSYGRSLVPRVYFRSPRVCITATNPELVYHAKVVEAVDNQMIRETLLKDTLKRAALDAYLCGTGPIKLGYDSEFGYLPEQAVSEDGQTVTQVGRKEGEKIEYHEGIKPGMPWALRVMPEDVIIPWGSTSPDSLPWVAHYILRPLEDVQQDQKYKNIDKLKGTKTPDREMGRTRPEFRPREQRDKDVIFAELWEIRDLKAKRMIVLSEDYLLMDTEDVLQFEGLPWEFIQFNVDPEYFWAIPDVSILEPQQKELNEVRTQSSRHRRIALLKFLYLRGAVKSEELEKFFSGEVGPGIAIDSESLANAITTLQPHIPPELWQEARMILQDMTEELGFGSNQMGQFKGGTPPTRGEAQIVEQAFDVRVDERKDIVGDILVSIVRKWNQMIFKFWTEDRVTQIVSPEGTPFWIKYTGDQLKGEYFLSVDPESGMPLNRALKYQMAKDLFNLLGGDQLIDQVLLRKILLQHYESVEPLASNLLAAAPGQDARAVSALRQPSPMGAEGAGGSRQRPLEFEEAKRKFTQGMA